MRRVVIGVAAVLLLSTSGFAGVVESQLLSAEEIRLAAKENREVADFIERNGLPELAETRRLSNRPPWDDHEITLYYLEDRLEISFSRAVVLGEPNLAVMRYERALTDADIQVLSRLIATMPTGSRQDLDFGQDVAVVEPTGWAGAAKMLGLSTSGGGVDGAVERAESAAVRADLAAARIERSSDTTEQAAARTERVIERLDKSSSVTRR